MQRCRLRSPLLVLVASACSTDIQVADKDGSAPAAVINAPDDGASFGPSDLIQFVGTVVDPDDDVSTVFWTSTVDGELATIETAAPDADGVSRVSVVLTPGMHGITLRVTDEGGRTSEDGIEVAVGEGQQEPTAQIDSPVNFAEVLPGDPIELVGAVSDPQDAADTLAVQWTVTENTTNTVLETLDGAPNAGGLTTSSWTPGEPGNFRIGLQATDSDANVALAEVLVLVVDPDLADLDQDGFPIAAGDCDDHDPGVNPNADETCGDATDQDCNTVVDDKDLDLDGHIDAACVNYTGTTPIDDCDDADPLTHGGAYELPDAKDNDCDGAIDNGGPGYDDDGDCFCEVGPCLGSAEPTCTTVADGDCDDDLAAVNPAAIDDPDRLYLDLNCDTIDGDLLNSVFLDPVLGNDTNGGLDPLAPVRTLSAAYGAAQANGVDWILIATGTLSFTGGGDQFVEGVNLAGGYDPTWVRSTLDVPTITVPASGRRIAGWFSPTAWHQVRIASQVATVAGSSSIALVLDGSVGLVLVDAEVSSSDGADGNDGGSGSVGGAGSAGSGGGNGCEDSSFICSDCTNPVGGNGGGACSGSGSGGKGGNPGIGGGDGLQGSSGNAVGGGGCGSAGQSNGGDGGVGSPGAVGAEGSGGLPGGAVGTFSGFGYTPANGTVGGLGSAGAGGGGGGGGAGGGWTFANCDTWGGGGGGGGGGGCGGTGGTGGLGGGASVAIVLANGSSIEIVGGWVETGDGGRGGDGGTGGNGGSGGNGGGGGASETSIISESSGDGGVGGKGGAGGRGGHGGGGGGGPAIGIVCRTGSQVALDTVSFGVGSGGLGGGGAGSPGTIGLTADDDGC